MPANLYGSGDNFDPQRSHVLPAMICKFPEAEVKGDGHVILWGIGAPWREFLHVDDCADACLFLMEHYEGADIVNIGVGQDIAISGLAELVRQVVGFEGASTATVPNRTGRRESWWTQAG